MAYQLNVDVPDQMVTVGGAARLRQFRGDCNATLSGDLERCKVSLNGSLTVVGAIRASCLKVSDALVCHEGVAGGEVTARKISVGAGTEQVRHLAADEISVKGIVRGMADRKVTIVSRRLNVRGMSHVELSSPAEGTLEARVTTRIDDCRITAPDANLELGGVAHNLITHGIDSLKAKELSGSLDVGAHTVIDVGSIKGRGKCCAQRINVTDDVIGEPGRINLIADQVLTIGGDVFTATLTCNGRDAGAGISVGNPVKLGLPEVEAEKTLPTKPTKQLATGGRELSECVIVSDRSAQIRGDVRGSLLAAEGSLEVEGNLDLSDVVVGSLLESSSPATLAVFGDDASIRPVRTPRLLVTGTITFGRCQRLTDSALVSCSLLKHGVVEVTGDQGRAALGRVEGSSITADAVGILEAPAEAVIHAYGLLHLGDGAPHGNQFKLNGDGVVQGELQASLMWAPDGSARRCTLRAGGEEVTVWAPPAEPDAQLATLAVEGERGVVRLRVEGSLHIERIPPETTSNRRSRLQEEPRIPVCEQLSLGENADLHVPSGPHITSQGFKASVVLDAGEVTLTADAATIHATDLLLRIGKSASPTTLIIVPEGRVRIEEPQEQPVSRGRPRPTIHIVSGEAVIAAALTEVHCLSRSSEEMAPNLRVMPQGRITSLTGTFRLGRLEHAQIRGRRRTGRSIHWLSRKKGFGWLRPWAERKDAPPVLVGIAAQGSDSDERPYPEFLGGQLLGVDVTQLPFTEIEPLAHLHVFDPEGPALIDHAIENQGQEKRQDRSQRMALLMESVSGKALSGATRSALLWAVARSHHAAVDRRHWLERLMRFLHRMVGYGYRPGPALVTYLLTVLLVAGLLWRFEGSPACAMSETAAFVDGPYSFGEQVLRVLMLPAGLLRLELGGAATYAPIGCHAALHLGVFAVTGTLLVYLVLALRNYLRTPKE
ncbi:hypothetical protein ACFQZ2_05825 [Streptomonospora algeriensis]|uniref:Membrane-associated oxidoreductase n=1 Tax=Streptomonospora algeriensis TaxID=995084 RepID=A0ABW3BBM2_9ACTN